jgi:hypothetical protein
MFKYGFRRFLLGCLFALVIVFMCCDRLRRIKPMVGHRPLLSLNIHASFPNSLRVDGVMYDRVTGAYPYYLEIQDTKSIFFETEGRSGSTYHLYNLRERRDIKFPNQYDHLGHGIHGSVGGNNTVIQSSSARDVVLFNIDRGVKRWFRLDVTTKQVDEIHR